MTTPLEEQLERMARRHGLRDIYVFGSRAGEIAQRVRAQAPITEPLPLSDVDVAVEPLLGRLTSAEERVSLTLELEDLFDAPRVDLVMLSEAPSRLALEVVRGELLHTSDPLAQAEHELYVLRRAADLAPFEKERVRMILEEGAR